MIWQAANVLLILHLVIHLIVSSSLLTSYVNMHYYSFYPNSIDNGSGSAFDNSFCCASCMHWH